MSVIGIILVLCAFAGVMFLIWKYVPGIAKTILLIVLGCGLVIWFLNLIGVLGTITGARVG